MTTAQPKARPKPPPPTAANHLTIVPPQSEEMRQLRALAGERYITSECSLAELREQPDFQNLHRNTISGWAKRDQWVARRQAFQKSVRDRVIAEMGDELVRSRIAQIKRLERLAKLAFKAIEAKPKAHSLEGMVHAYIRVAEFLDAQYQKILDGLPENATRPENVTPPPMKANLTQEEAAAAAMTVIRMRREQMRADVEAERGAAS